MEGVRLVSAATKPAIIMNRALGHIIAYIRTLGTSRACSIHVNSITYSSGPNISPLKPISSDCNERPWGMPQGGGPDACNRLGTALIQQQSRMNALLRLSYFYNSTRYYHSSIYIALPLYIYIYAPIVSKPEGCKASGPRLR